VSRSRTALPAALAPVEENPLGLPGDPGAVAGARVVGNGRLEFPLDRDQALGVSPTHN
jgi:hypothetical protein